MKNEFLLLMATLAGVNTAAFTLTQLPNPSGTVSGCRQEINIARTIKVVNNAKDKGIMVESNQPDKIQESPSSNEPAMTRGAIKTFTVNQSLRIDQSKPIISIIDDSGRNETFDCKWELNNNTLTITLEAVRSQDYPAKINIMYNNGKLIAREGG